MCYKDLNSLMVFYYCLGLCNDDEICVNYLNIFLLEIDDVDWFFKEDEYGYCFEYCCKVFKME